MTKRWVALLSALGAFSQASCAATTSEQKSTGTNWITCSAARDCAVVEGATCSDQHVCIDTSGKPISQTRVSDLTQSDAGGDGSALPPADAGSNCPPWSMLNDTQGIPTVCTHGGLICTYTEGQAECAPDGPVLKWWSVGAGLGCPERRPSSGSSCALPGTECGYISGLPADTDFVVNSCCDGNTQKWGPTPSTGCPNGNTCGTIDAANYDHGCTVDADCVMVTSGDLCQATCTNCGNAAISASADPQYEDDFSKKLSTGPLVCPCPFIAPAVCKQGVCTPGGLP